MTEPEDAPHLDRVTRKIATRTSDAENSAGVGCKLRLAKTLAFIVTPILAVTLLTACVVLLDAIGQCNAIGLLPAIALVAAICNLPHSVDDRIERILTWSLNRRHKPPDSK